MSIYNNQIDFRQLGDQAADEFIFKLCEEKKLSELFSKLNSNPNPDDLISYHLFFESFFKEAKAIQWDNNFDNLDYYKGHYFLSLGFYSLPYCYSAAKGAQSLYYTAYLKNDAVKRLSETAAFVNICLKPLLNNEDINHLLINILKVRFYHSISRFHLKQKIKGEMPINQEDMLGTLLSFWFIPLKGMNKMGINLLKSDSEKLAQHWANIGLLLGLNSDLYINSLINASKAEVYIRNKEFKHSKEGAELLESLIKSLAEFSKSDPQLIRSLIAYFLDDKNVFNLKGNIPLFQKEILYNLGFKFKENFAQIK